jgi:hypothetical protein
MGLGEPHSKVAPTDSIQSLDTHYANFSSHTAHLKAPVAPRLGQSLNVSLEKERTKSEKVLRNFYADDILAVGAQILRALGKGTRDVPLKHRHEGYIAFDMESI